MFDITILVVEDDRAIRNLITTTLETQHYVFYSAKTGESAIMEAVSRAPNIIILDLGLPDMDGIDVIKKIRGWSNVPIIVVSARSEDRDKIEALDAGADDFLTKPFSVEELLARLRVTIRRLNYDAQVQPDETEFINGALRIDYTTRLAYIDEEEIHLTPIEYKLLCLLAKNVGKVLTHNYILQKVWANALAEDVPSLRVFMATLRKKIEKDTAHPQYIQTHIGVGYQMLQIEQKKG